MTDPSTHDDYWTGWQAGRAAGLEAGWDRGYREGLHAAAEELAARILHQRSLEALGGVRELAEARHGPSWAGLVIDDESPPP